MNPIYFLLTTCILPEQCRISLTLLTLFRSGGLGAEAEKVLPLGVASTNLFQDGDGVPR